MYEAKRMRTGHEVYLPARDRHSRERLALVGELRGALEAGELVLHYQPKADAARRARCAASRRSCAGSTRSAACSAPGTSCRWSSRAG